MAVLSILGGIGAAITGGALAAGSTAAAVTGGIAVAGATAAIGGGIAGSVSALSKGKGSGGVGAGSSAPYNEAAEKKKAAEQANEATKKRLQGQTVTTRTSALGSLGGATTGKKTLLGG